MELELTMVALNTSKTKKLSNFLKYFAFVTFLDVNDQTFYKGYFRNGKKCGDGTLNYLLKHKIQKGIWMDGSCVTSILQDDVRNDSMIPFKGCMAEVRVNLKLWIAGLSFTKLF